MQRKLKLTAIALILSIATSITPAYAQDYDICLTDERSEWPAESGTRPRFTTFHVVPDAEDKDARLLDGIVKGLQLEGLKVSTGPVNEAPDDADIIVTFKTNWVWDLHDKLHGSIIYFRDAASFSVLMVAQQFDTAGLITSMPTVEVPRMINRLKSNDFATPLCWSSQSDE
jgi:hypothetical protein